MAFDRRLAAVACAGLASFINLYAPQAILPALATSFAVPIAATTLLVTAPLVAVAAVAPFVGTLSVRLWRKRLIVTACAILVLPTLGLAVVPSLALAILLRFMQGLTLPFIFTVTIAYIGDEFEGASNIQAAGIYAMGTIFGGFLGRFLAGIAADFGGWRAAFLAIGLVTLAVALFIAGALPRERNFRPVRGGIAATLATYRDHLANPQLIATFFLGFGMLFTNVACFTYVNFYLAAPPFGLGPAALGFIFTVYLVGLAATTVGTRIAIRLGRRPALAVALTLAIAGLLLTLVRRLPVVIAGLALLVSGLFVVQALSTGYLGVAARRAKSTAVGLYVTVFYIGGSLGGLLPGLLWSRTGWPGVVAILTLLDAAMMVVGTAVWRDPPPGRHPSAAD